MKIYALVTVQGTAIAASGLCARHYWMDPSIRQQAYEAARSGNYPESDRLALPPNWEDVTGNEEIVCTVCGRGS